MLARGLGPRESLTAFAREYVSAVLGSQKHIAIYTREEKNLDPEDAKRLGVMRREFFGRISQLLERGVAAGEFHVEDPLLAALGIGGAVTWSAFWYRPNGRLDMAQIARSMTGLILGLAGVRPESAPARKPRARAKTA